MGEKRKSREPSVSSPGDVKHAVRDLKRKHQQDAVLAGDDEGSTLFWTKKVEQDLKTGTKADAWDPQQQARERELELLRVRARRCVFPSDAALSQKRDQVHAESKHSGTPRRLHSSVRKLGTMLACRHSEALMLCGVQIQQHVLQKLNDVEVSKDTMLAHLSPHMRQHYQCMPSHVLQQYHTGSTAKVITQADSPAAFQRAVRVRQSAATGRFE